MKNSLKDETVVEYVDPKSNESKHYWGGVMISPDEHEEFVAAGARNIRVPIGSEQFRELSYVLPIP